MWKGYHLLVEGTRKDYTFSVKNIWYTKGEGVGPQCGSSPYKTLLSTHLPGLWVACEQALLFGLRRLLARSGETCFARLNRRVCLQAGLWVGEMASYTRLGLTVQVVLWSPYDCSEFSIRAALEKTSRSVNRMRRLFEDFKEKNLTQLCNLRHPDNHDSISAKWINK